MVFRRHLDLHQHAVDELAAIVVEKADELVPRDRSAASGAREHGRSIAAPTSARNLVVRGQGGLITP